MEECIILIGTNHKYSTPTTRSKIFSNQKSTDDWVKNIYIKLKQNTFPEKVALVTCNRIEIYAVTKKVKKAKQELKNIIGSKDIYHYTGKRASSHLFEVACGLDSAVIGELEILGQVKKAYQTAIKEKTIGTILHKLYRDAIHIGKFVRANTTISFGSTSIGNAVLLLSNKYLGKKRHSILIIGAGDIARQSAKQLCHYANITITNRNNLSALSLSKSVGGKTILFNDLANSLKNYDIIISAVSSFKKIISFSIVKNHLENIEKQICFIDLANPNTIDAKIKEIKNISLYQLDEIQEKMNNNKKLRLKAVEDVNKLIYKNNQKFWEWYFARNSIFNEYK